MKSKILGLLAAGLLAVSATANAVVVTVDGQSLDITARTGTVTELLDLLDDQIWWGDFTKAVKWADALGGQLGYPNSNGGYDYSPYFASSQMLFSGSDSLGYERNLGFGIVPPGSFTFAIAERVSEPGTLALLGLGLLGLGLTRRKAA